MFISNFLFLFFNYYSFSLIVNPFYQASESDIAETPGMIVTPNSSFTTYNETPSRMYSIQSKLDDEMRRMEQLQDDLLEIKEQVSMIQAGK